MTGPPRDPEQARAAMVEHQLRDRGVTDERVLAAMGAIPREAFVPDASRRDAYADGALPIESRPDDQPAADGRQDDRAARGQARRPDPRDRHRLRLPGRDPRLARCRRDLARTPGGADPAGPRTSRGARAGLAGSSRSARRTAASATRPGPRGTGSSSPRLRRPCRRSCASNCATAAGWSSRSGRATASC